MNDSTKAAFDALAELLHHNLEQDLEHNRKEIEEILTPEILKRYYYQKGVVIAGLKNDKAMDTVADLFAKPGEYERILHPVKK